MKIIKRAMYLFSKLKNFHLFVYLCFHYCRKYVPKFLAKRICKKNFGNKYKYGTSVEIFIDTYDFSGQSVHPDICIDDDGMYHLVLTPYPYGMEEYENPCLYLGENIESLNLCSISPIDFPSKHSFGYHLSDPTILISEGKNIIIYRESERISQNIERNSWKKIIIKDEKILEKKSIFSSEERDLLSPAIIENYDHQLYIFYVDKCAEKTKLFYLPLENSTILESKELLVDNLCEDEYIWHIGITSRVNKLKILNYNEGLSGLFLTKNIVNFNFKLYYAESDKIESNWKILYEISIPTHLSDQIKHLYKSCFIPNSDDILISARDKKDRYRIFKINNTRSLN